MVAAHIAQVSKYGKPRSEYLRFQLEIVGNEFSQPVARYVGIDVIQVAERQNLGNHPRWRIILNVVLPKTLNALFLACCQLFLYDGQCMPKFIIVGKILRLCYPILIASS